MKSPYFSSSNGFTALSSDRLKEFVRLLDRWRRITNLISNDDFDIVWQRHIFDSIHLHRIFPDKLDWVDFGTGAGFPGIILGIMLAEQAGAKISCIEADGRKCAFLRTAVDRLDLPVKIYNRRATGSEIELTGKSEIVTARAFSSIDNMLQLSHRYLKAGAILVLPRGKSSLGELETVDPIRYSSSIHANPNSGGGYFVQIQARVVTPK